MEESFNNILSNRISIIRNSYGFPLKECVGLCNSVSVASLTSWEAKTRVPAVEGIFDFAVSYAVRMDWLCGATETPYTSDFILYAETVRPVNMEFLYKFVVDYMGTGSPYPDGDAMDMLEKYSNIETRNTAFSLGARANLYVLSRYIDMAIESSKSAKNIKPSLQQKRLMRLRSAIQSVRMILSTGQEANPLLPF